MEKTITIDKKYNVSELYQFARGEQLKKIYPKLNTRRSFELVTSRIRKEAIRRGLIHHEFTKNDLVLIIKALDIVESTKVLYISRLSVLLTVYNTGKSIYAKRRPITKQESNVPSISQHLQNVGPERLHTTIRDIGEFLFGMAWTGFWGVIGGIIGSFIF